MLNLKKNILFISFVILLGLSPVNTMPMDIVSDGIKTCCRGFDSALDSTISACVKDAGKKDDIKAVIYASPAVGALIILLAVIQTKFMLPFSR